MNPLQLLKRYWQCQGFNKFSKSEITVMIRRESSLKVINVFEKKQ